MNAIKGGLCPRHGEVRARPARTREAEDRYTTPRRVGREEKNRMKSTRLTR